MTENRAFVFETSWGWAAAAFSEFGVLAFEMPDSSPDNPLARLLARPIVQSTTPQVSPAPYGDGEMPTDDHAGAQLVGEVRLYFEHSLRSFRTPIDFDGITPFRRRVLQALRETPFSVTLTYGALAARAGRRGAARAVGGAVAANPVPLLIPCHRVMASAGELGGYSAHGGADLKRRLLKHEGVSL